MAGPPDPPDPDRTTQGKKKKGNPPSGGSQTGIRDFFQRMPSQSSASGRGAEPTLPGSSSDPQLTRGSRSGGADVPPGRPRAPTIESLASGFGSLTTTPSSLGRVGPSTLAAPPGSPSLGRGGPSTSALPPGSPSLGRGSPSLSRVGPSTSAAPPGSPSLGRGGPSTSALPPGSPSLGRGSPQVSTTPKIVFKTFRAIRTLNEGEIKTLNNSPAGPGFISLQIGAFGLIPNIPENFPNGELCPHPLVQLLRQGPAGALVRSDTHWPNGRCRVPKSIIEIGTFVREDVELIDETKLPNLTLNLQLSPNIPLQKFLESFLASLSAVETLAQLKLHGVNGTLADIASQPDKCRLFVKEFINGMDYCGSLKLFRNGLPKLDDIWNKLRYIDSTTTIAPFTKNGTYIYILMYYNEKDGSISLYIGRTVGLLARYKQHSRCLSKNHDLMHYRVAVKRLREGATYRLFPIAFLPQAMPNVKLFQSWAETIPMVLFGSFSPMMLNSNKPLASNELLPPDELARLSKSLKRDSYLQICGAPLSKLLLNVAGRIKASDSSLKGFASNERFTGLN
ncbi:hypothetical protein FSST1_004897 [Fusarium sambucinum]